MKACVFRRSIAVAALAALLSLDPGCGGGNHTLAPVPIAAAMARAGQETVAAASASQYLGVSVRIPADSVPPGTTVRVYSARPTPDAFTTVGPGIRVEVSAALASGVFATVALPYDPKQVASAGGTSKDILVVSLTGGGTSLFPPPRTTLTANSTVTVRVTGFSTFVATLADGPASFPPAPPPLRGGVLWWPWRPTASPSVPMERCSRSDRTTPGSSGARGPACGRRRGRSAGSPGRRK